MTSVLPVTGPLPAGSAGTRSRARPAARRRRSAGRARRCPRSPPGSRPAEPGAGPDRPLHHRHQLPRGANLGITPPIRRQSARQPRLVQLTRSLWAEPKGHAWTYQAAYDLVLRLRARTGIAFDPHWFRHTAATRWLRDGVSVEVVSKLLGHSSVSTTSAIYGKPRELHQTGEKLQVA